MKFEHVRVMNLENAFRGMRHPKESYHLSDSEFGLDSLEHTGINYEVARKWADFILESEKDNPEATKAVLDRAEPWLLKNGALYCSPRGKYFEYAFIGPKDLRLAQQLIHGGSEHRKFMRQIFVSVDITAPLYWWKEFDTYKVGTTANSTSTMHKIQSKTIDWDCFETDDFCEDVLVFDPPEYDGWIKDQAQYIIDICETLRQKYNETGEKKYWKALIRWLPASWLQTRTVTMTYENLLAMCSPGQRRYHKLNEWSGKWTDVDESFIQFARSLPYAKELIFMDEIDMVNFPKIDFI